MCSQPICEHIGCEKLYMTCSPTASKHYQPNLFSLISQHSQEQLNDIDSKKQGSIYVAYNGLS